MEKQILLLLLFDKWQYSKPWRKKKTRLVLLLYLVRFMLFLWCPSSLGDCSVKQICSFIFQTAGAQRLVHLWWMVQTEVPAWQLEHQSSRRSFLICTDGSFLSHWAVFSFQARGDFGGYLVWLSHPPPVLIPAHAMKQNTGDMSGSKALSGCQKHLPKYLHLLLLFIHHQCGDLLLVLGEHPLSQSFLISKKV